MIELRIHHRNSEEQATMRDELCRSLVGWKPFIDTEVAVCDTGSTDPEPITRLVLGPNPTNDGELVVVLDVKAEDMMCHTAEYVLPKGYPIPKMYDEKENAK